MANFVVPSFFLCSADAVRMLLSPALARYSGSIIGSLARVEFIAPLFLMA
jgi:hypothetical protein